MKIYRNPEHVVVRKIEGIRKTMKRKRERRRRTWLEMIRNYLKDV